MIQIVEASNARPTDTGVELGVDVDVTIRMPSGQLVEGEVTLLPAEDGRPRYTPWGMPDHWVSSPLLDELKALPDNDFSDALTLIAEATSEVAGKP